MLVQIVLPNFQAKSSAEKFYIKLLYTYILFIFFYIEICNLFGNDQAENVSENLSNRYV